ncbi:MAG: nucleoside 2-deoxyribosyltransferase [Thermodesulfobacteriota bacterium]
MTHSDDKKIVYCSGPLFCPEEIGAMTAIARVLEQSGYATFLPHRDGLEAHVMKFLNSPLGMNVLKSRQAVDRLIFALDVFQIVERCACIVVNTNGRVPDEGAVAEAAIAFMAGKPVVLYKNDCRSVFRGRDNSMVTGLATGPVAGRLADIPKAVQKVCAAGQGAVNAEKVLPPDVAGTVTLGKKVWRLMAFLGADGGPAKEAQGLAAEIAEFCATYQGREVES